MHALRQNARREERRADHAADCARALERFDLAALAKPFWLRARQLRTTAIIHRAQAYAIQVELTMWIAVTPELGEPVGILHCLCERGEAMTGGYGVSSCHPLIDRIAKRLSICSDGVGWALKLPGWAPISWSRN